jgi:CHASE3 domain sensor protein
MKWKMEGRLVFWGFLVAAVILVFVGWQSYRYMIRVDEAADARKHSHEVLRTLDETLARLVDAETGQRGYLLTGDEAYLEPYRGAIKDLDQLTGQLKALTSYRTETGITSEDDRPPEERRIRCRKQIGP